MRPELYNYINFMCAGEALHSLRLIYIPIYLSFALRPYLNDFYHAWTKDLSCALAGTEIECNILL